MEHDLSYLRSDYAREKMIEQYHKEEQEKEDAEYAEISSDSRQDD